MAALDPQKTVYVDTFAQRGKNGIVLEEWNGDPEDKELLKLMNILLELGPRKGKLNRWLNNKMVLLDEAKNLLLGQLRSGYERMEVDNFSQSSESAKEEGAFNSAIITKTVDVGQVVKKNKCQFL